MRCENVIAVKI